MSKINGLFPPVFCDFVTVYRRNEDGSFKVSQIKGCKFSNEKTEFSKDIRASIKRDFYARIPVGNCVILPGDILVKGVVFEYARKGQEGEDILGKFPLSSFRVKTVSFCGNHIYVKG